MKLGNNTENFQVTLKRFAEIWSNADRLNCCFAKNVEKCTMYLS